MINPVHHAKHFKNKFNNEKFPISKAISKQSFHLPSGTGLSNQEINYISKTVELSINN